jgi:hypothetical protein
VHGRRGTNNFLIESIVGLSNKRSARITAVVTLMTALDSMVPFEFVPCYPNTAKYMMLCRWSLQQCVFGRCCYWMLFGLSYRLVVAFEVLFCVN